MLVKDKFLKKNKLNFFFKIFFLLFFTKFLFANITDEKDILITYLQNIKNFSANFIQSDGQSIEEGMVYIGKNRIRVDYFNPSKISIVMDQDKAMYVNYDLGEIQYFDPQNSEAGIFINIFGGIIRCDMIAEGIINAARELNLKLPVIMRLQGTNADKGRKIINNSINNLKHFQV